MNLIDPALPVVHASIDAAGRLTSADERLAMLNAGAGGEIGRPIAVPQLATLARLAQRLRTLVSRAVVVADGGEDLELWVRATPESDGGVRLAITGWRHRGAWVTPVDAPRARDFVAGEGGWAWSADGALRLTHVALEAGRRHGFDPAALLGKPVTALFRVREGEDGKLPMLGALALRERFSGQRAVLRANGAQVLLSAVPLADATGGFAGLDGVAIDMPAPAAMPAEASDAFTTRLDAALRAPLGRIIAHADSINAQAEGPLRQDYADYAADIAAAGRHLLGLVDDLVDLQAIERPDYKPAAEPIDLADIGRRAAGLLQVRAAAARVRIDKPGHDESLPATGEFRRVLQIMVNLIGNAVRYSPADATVWVRCDRDGDRAIAIVADQGKGIALEDQDRIFGKFERVDASEPGGSGLGLYIARRLARAMGGDIMVDSAPGQGARFIVSLPAR
ncbi:PAS domain-containing sensor histidine kinase [Sphingomonas sp.]|uniref:sensor histidine kinase n=1 Tax=Sphingomonas sp. TaxID=28214 RepID=UPI001E1520CF|nr:PAS domain-containing sensor histidine kinase [Sphingomonas sp.]MBX9796145.1 PAS domain-containing sensor histidine kinase [Sphingomonas sp.]